MKNQPLLFCVLHVMSEAISVTNISSLRPCGEKAARDINKYVKLQSYKYFNSYLENSLQTS